ncbi:hypothetical protein [Halomarina oriensis]|uniref:Domain of unknown function domain-containing protein n=1 Tax=Halomarina oriensis TaxID=671145 RepID=A0A6B0GVT5_9EURY|nr:hypothetical protein [Halomarina oriensis]MWG35818.1 hypothetical protein [Halomarina oriensis]
MNGDDRDRGLLSSADRAFLRGEADLSSVQSERNARARIRDRVYDGVLDFELLVERLSERDRTLVFEKRFGSMEGTAAHDALVSALAFVYRAVGDTDLDFEDVLREAVNVAEASEDRAASVDLDVTYHSLTVPELRRKLDRGESLSLTELAFLQSSEEVSLRELARYFEDADAARQGIDDGRIQSKVTEF